MSLVWQKALTFTIHQKNSIMRVTNKIQHDIEHRYGQFCNPTDCNKVSRWLTCSGCCGGDTCTYKERSAEIVLSHPKVDVIHKNKDIS